MNMEEASKENKTTNKAALGPRTRRRYQALKKPKNLTTKFSMALLLNCFVGNSAAK